MPPIRTESSQKLVNQEGKILLALDDIKNSCIKSIRAAVKLYDLPCSTLHAHAHRRSSHIDKYPSDHKLIQYKEDSLIEWILSIDLCGTASRPSTVREMANILFTVYGTIFLLTVGVNWVSIFVKQCDKL